MLEIEVTGAFSSGGMSAIFIRDPDRHVIELDVYEATAEKDSTDYRNHPKYAVSRGALQETKASGGE